MAERDLDLNPYSPEEIRVGEFLQRITNDQVGWGDDPIGFMLCCYQAMVDERKERKKKARKMSDLILDLA